MVKTVGFYSIGHGFNKNRSMNKRIDRLVSKKGTLQEVVLDQMVIQTEGGGNLMSTSSIHQSQL